MFAVRTGNTRAAVRGVTCLRPCLAVPLALGVSLICPFALAQNPSAVGRYEAWRGGLTFQKLIRYHAVGTILKSGLSGTVEVSSEEDGRFRVHADLGAYKQDDVLNGDAAWSRGLSGGVAELRANEVADEARENALLYDGILHEQAGAVLSGQPHENLNATVCDVVRVMYPGSPSTYDYLISTSDGRLVAIRSNVAGAKQVTTFDDWRMVDGVRMAFVTRVSGTMPSDASITSYTHIDVNPSLPAELFAAPEKVNSALFAKGTTSSGWLPFEFFNRNRIFIPATVNGHQIKVMLDSGATSNVVDQRFSRSLGLQAEGAMTGQGASGGGATGIVSGVDLTLGTLAFKNTNAVSIDLSGIERRLGHPLPMILGGEAFTECVVDIDFLHDRIAFRDPASFQAPLDATSIALTNIEELHVLNAQVEGRPALLLFDIGNGGALALFPRFWDAPGFLDGRRTSTILSGGYTGANVSRLTTIRSLNIGGTTLADVPTTLDDTSSSMARSGRLDGNLGLPVYSRFRLLVDEPHGRVWFAPPVDATRPFAVNHSGLTLQSSPSGAKVLYVAPGSPGEIAGLKTDDMIVTVDGSPEQRAPQNNRLIHEWIYGAPGTTLKIGLASGQMKALALASYF